MSALDYNEHNARKLLARTEARIDQLDDLLGHLRTMLANGKFPVTQTNALENALSNVRKEFEDLEMEMLIKFENADLIN